MSQLNFKNPIVLVPTIILGVGVTVGALAYGVNSLFSSSSSSNASNTVSNRTYYSTSPSPVVNSSPPVSYDSPVSDGNNFVNSDTTNSSDLPYSSGGFHKKKKKKIKDEV
jgi:hypothetical protein